MPEQDATDTKREPPWKLNPPYPYVGHCIARFMTTMLLLSIPSLVLLLVATPLRGHWTKIVLVMPLVAVLWVAVTELVFDYELKPL